MPSHQMLPVRDSGLSNSKACLTCQALLAKITFTTDRDALNGADLIVEAIIEDLPLKERLYADLGQRCKQSTVFASNTSSLSITQMALASRRPAQFVGLHFFNPVQVMRLVEVIRTDYTDPAVFDRTAAWVEDIGKVRERTVARRERRGTRADEGRPGNRIDAPSLVRDDSERLKSFPNLARRAQVGVQCRDTPGFIVNRLLVPSLVQAMLLVERGDASVKDVDLSMKLGAGHP